MFRKKNKLKKLEEKLKKLRSKRDSCKGKVKYHTDQRDLSKGKDFDKWTKHKDKLEFYEDELGLLRKDVEVVKAKIVLIQNRLEKVAYSKKLKEFNQVISGFIDFLIKHLEKREYNEASILSQKLYNTWVKQKPSFRKDDLKIDDYIGLLSVKTRIGRIAEEHATVIRTTALRGSNIAAQKRSNVEVWTSQLVGQLNTCLKMLKK